MRKEYTFKLLVAAAVCFTACVRSEPEPESVRLQPRCELSVAAARAFYEKNGAHQTRSGADGAIQGVFGIGELSPDWSRAEPSAAERLSCVDVPAETDSEFRILRKRGDGSMYEVRAFGKLLVAKSAETDSLALYMRYVVPDEHYAAACEGDLSELSANCEDRVDYCGLEIYTLLDGAIVAVARYHEGVLWDQVFLGDPQLSPEEKDIRLRRLMRGVYIHRKIVAQTRAVDDWDFGGVECFYDSTGRLYFVDYIRGQGYATMDFDGDRGSCSHGKVVGGGGGGNSGGPDDGNNGNNNGHNGNNDNPGNEWVGGGNGGGGTGGGTGGGGDPLIDPEDDPDKQWPRPLPDIDPNPFRPPVLLPILERYPMLRTSNPIITRRLEILLLDCMGNKLFGSFDRPLHFLTIPGSGASYNPATNTISMGENAPLIALLEELIHAFQNWNILAGENDHTLNDEIEAKFGWVLYLKREGKELEPYKKALGLRQGVDAFTDLYEIFVMGFLFTPENNFEWYRDTYYDLIDIFRSPGSPYNDPAQYSFSDRYVNFDNLAELMSDC